MYGHVEPVIGIASSHPLNDTTVYDDDEVLHYTDGGVNTVHRTLSSLAGDWAGPGEKADCGDYDYCIGNPYGYGWAVKGFADKVDSVPASLKIDPWMREPDTRSGEAPDAIQGTLTATELEVGAVYDVYRWDSVKEALTYTDDYKKTTFTADSDTHVRARARRAHASEASACERMRAKRAHASEASACERSER
jgi:hypothetical protein